MIRRVTATRFLKKPTLGRTKPLVMAADDEEPVVEAVVKFSTRCDERIAGLVKEAFCACLAGALEVPVPEPLIVDVPEEVRLQIPAELRPPPGDTPAFGSRLCVGNLEVMPDRDKLPADAIPGAFGIIAFDALTDNRDRKPGGNPNLLWNGGAGFHAIDHELCFPSAGLILLGPQSNCWDAGGLHWLSGHDGHALVPLVKGRRLGELDRVRDNWIALSEAELDAYRRHIPAEWQAHAGLLDKAIEHVLRVKMHIDQCFAELGRVLA